jgi:hypothetical protein
MKKYNIHVPGGFYAGTIYGNSKRDALNAYRLQWYPARDRLPRGVAIWEAN